MNWTRLPCQGCGIVSSEKDKISNNWLERDRGIPHRNLVTALQLRAKVYPARESLARGQQESQVKTCQRCQAESETCSLIIGYCPEVQDARIKSHQLCDPRAEEAQKGEWSVFHEPLLRDHRDELHKPGLTFLKGSQALVADITIRYKSIYLTSVDIAHIFEPHRGYYIISILTVNKLYLWVVMT